LFESNRVYLQKFSNKTRKEKRKEKRKKKKASGTVSSPTTEAARGPFPLPPESVFFSLSSCR
jgi:hypothetical protein